MRRRTQSDDSSLELLLDTITNTFGGVLFLAILVALMLRTTAPAVRHVGDGVTAPMSPEERASLEMQVAAARDDLVSTQEELQAVHTNGRGTESPVVDESRSLIDAIARAVDDRAEAVTETADYQERTKSAEEHARLEAESQAKIRKRLRDAEKARDEAAEVAATLTRSRLNLETAEQRPTIDVVAGFPTLRGTEKRQVGLYLRFGRLYMMHAWRTGVRLGPNPDHFFVAPGSPPVAVPRPGAGLVVTDATIHDSVRLILADFPPRDWAVAAVLFGDSHEHFQLLRKALVESGYEYNPMPVKPGGSVVDAGGTSQAQ